MDCHQKGMVKLILLSDMFTLFVSSVCGCAGNISVLTKEVVGIEANPAIEHT